MIFCADRRSSWPFMAGHLPQIKRTETQDQLETSDRQMVADLAGLEQQPPYPTGHGTGLRAPDSWVYQQGN